MDKGNITRNTEPRNPYRVVIPIEKAIEHTDNRKIEEKLRKKRKRGQKLVNAQINLIEKLNTKEVTKYMSLEIDVGQTGIDLEKGYHKGEVVDIELQTSEKDGETYHYLRVHVRPDEVEENSDATLTISAPFYKDKPVNQRQGRGQIYEAITGEKIREQETVDFEDLIGKRIEFMTKKNEDGFTEISEDYDTITPLEEK